MTRQEQEQQLHQSRVGATPAWQLQSVYGTQRKRNNITSLKQRYCITSPGTVRNTAHHWGDEDRLEDREAGPTVLPSLWCHTVCLGLSNTKSITLHWQKLLSAAYHCKGDFKKRHIWQETIIMQPAPLVKYASHPTSSLKILLWKHTINILELLLKKGKKKWGFLYNGSNNFWLLTKLYWR